MSTIDINRVAQCYEKGVTRFPDKLRLEMEKSGKGAKFIKDDKSWEEGYDKVVKKLYISLLSYLGENEFRPPILPNDRVFINRITKINDEYKLWLKTRYPESHQWSMYVFPDRWMKFFKRMRKLGLVTCSPGEDTIWYYKLDISKLDQVRQDVFLDYL